MAQPDNGFAPIGAVNPTLLILGSMPGQASLQAQQYYAHPRNAFWPLMDDLLGVSFEKTYETRAQILADLGVMVWDVVRQAEREGSLDAAIVDASVAVNDFSFLTRSDSAIKQVLCNGQKSYDLFVKHAAKPLSLTVPVLKMPSTSPANAATNYQKKREAWSIGLASLLESESTP